MFEIFCQLSPAQTSIMEGVGQLTALAVVLGVFVWLVTHHVPKMYAKFSDSLDAQRKDFKDELSVHRKHDWDKAKGHEEKVGGLTTAIDTLVVKIDTLKN